MALYDYMGALKLGKKQYHASVAKGEYPYLPVLDQILANADIVSEVNLGLVDVPLERIVGTKTMGRTQAFSSNFMPLLDEKSEFSAKWANLYDHQIEDGITDPIVVYEFMNRFYVLEGNKRVSVLKYLHAYSISAYVTRLIPRRSEDRENRLYYEFLDFYQVSFNCDVWFSREGCYGQLLEAMGKQPDEVWSEDDRLFFKGTYDLFKKTFESKRTEEINLTASDAFLVYVQIFGYEETVKHTESQMRSGLDKIWDELVLKSGGGKITLVEDPEELKAEPQPKGLLNWLMPAVNIEPEMIKVAFIHGKNVENSRWVRGHEQGRHYLESCYNRRLKTIALQNAGTEEAVEEALSQAILAGCNLIFTTAPLMAAASVKMAVQHPEVLIFNCSVNVSSTAISTYYVRMHEAKFLMGALAAAMCEDNRLGYIADFPVYGKIAGINAFALGAKMINPRVQIYLKWSGLKEHHCRKELEEEGITYISGDDQLNPELETREYGFYHKLPNGKEENLAIPLWDWGKFYETILEKVCSGAIGHKGSKNKKAINFWWGMSAGVVDVICSERIPPRTKQLLDLLISSIKNGTFHAFEGMFVTQDGTVIGSKDGGELSPEEIISMDWLLECIVGEIPDISEFTEEIQQMIRVQSAPIEDNSMEVQSSEDSGTGR